MTITTMYASVAVSRDRAHIALVYPNAPDQLIVHVSARHGHWLAWSHDPATPTWPDRETFAEAFDDAMAFVAQEAQAWTARNP